MVKDGFFDGYHPVTWFFAAIIGIFGFPIMLIVPGYFYWKVRNGTASEQTPLETASVIFFNILGIVAVELGGRKGAVAVWALIPVTVIASLIVGTFFMGL